MLSQNSSDKPVGHSTTSSEEIHSFNFGTFLSPMMAAASSRASNTTSTIPRGPIGSMSTGQGDLSPLLDPALDELNLDTPLSLPHLMMTPQFSPCTPMFPSAQASPLISPTRASSPGFSGPSSYSSTSQFLRSPGALKALAAAKAAGHSATAGTLLSSNLESKQRGKKPETHSDSMAPSYGDTVASPAVILECLRKARGEPETMSETSVLGLMQQIPASLVQEIVNRSMQIVVLGVAQHGAKSRVETQIRLGLQLVDSKGDTVTHWPHLRLPELSVIKDRGRNRQGQVIEQPPTPPIHQTLSLEATVICASNPAKKVEVCLGCIRREYKRAQRRKENRSRHFASNSTTPAQSRPGSPTGDHSNTSMETDWDEERIAMERHRTLIFNCVHLVEFHKGEVHLPARITCYCRHHAEKVGFCIYLTMKDHMGNVIATGISPPIMITDDHKSTKFKSDRKRPKAEYDPEGRLSHKNPAEINLGHDVSKARRSVLNSPATLKPAGGMSTIDSNTLAALSGYPSIANTPLCSNTPIPSPLLAAQLSPPSTPLFPPNFLSISPPTGFPANSPPYSQVALMPPPDRLVGPSYPGMPLTSYSPFVSSGQDAFLGANSVNIPDFTLLNESHNPMAITQVLTNSQSASPQSSVFSAQFSPTNDSRPPRIDRLVPMEGPVSGGTEVTLLGTGFHENLVILFGDTPAKVTHFWSSNTMVCVLPPSSVAGPVMVSFGESPTVGEFPSLVDNKDTVPIFTYVDDTERQLMELALQVVGIKMTGRIEDPRQIAMRIVSTEGGPHNGANRRTSAPSAGNMHGYNGMSASFPQSTSPLGSLSVDTVDLTTDLHNAATLPPPSPIDLSLSYFRTSPQHMGLLQDLSAAFRKQDVEALEVAVLAILSSLQTSFTLDENSLTLLHDKTNQTLLHAAAILGMAKLTQFLLDHGIKGDVQDGNGMTALHFASWVGHVEVVRVLLDAGVSHSLLTFNSKRPIDFASARALNDVVLLLEQREDYMDFLCDGDELVLDSDTAAMMTVGTESGIPLVDYRDDVSMVTVGGCSGEGHDDSELDDATLDSMSSSFTSSTSSLRTLVSRAGGSPRKDLATLSAANGSTPSTARTTTSQLFSLATSVFEKMHAELPLRRLPFKSLGGGNYLGNGSASPPGVGQRAVE